MTKHIREIAPSGIENVSRRGVLKGMLSTGGLVLAVHVLPSRSGAGRRRAQMGRRRHAARHGEQSSRFRVDCARRNRHHRLPSLRDGAGRANRHAADRRRRNGGRLGQGESRPGDRRRGQIRQPGHRRLPFDPPFLHADAPGWRRGPHDAGRGRSEALGRRRLRRGGEEPRGHPEVHREEARLWRTRRRRQHDGRPVERQREKTGAATPSACLSRTLRSSATSARKGPISSTASTSRPVAPFMARMSACPGRNTPSSRARR